MDGMMQLKSFKDINIDDPFFDTLKEDYKGFIYWFRRKAEEKAYILEGEKGIEAFLYLKIEKGPINDIVPPINDDEIIKIGTMKINPHGTRLGERFIKKAFDYAVNHGIHKLYVTVFPKHDLLINLYKRYGFVDHGKKLTSDGEELVLVKSFHSLKGDVLLDYPIIRSRGINKYLLAIYPKYHTRLFPDSILKNEGFSVIEDVSYTNSIHKIYICSMDGVSEINTGDILVIYRTSDKKGPAWYRSVATSICVVDKIKNKRYFHNLNDFIQYCKTYSVFTEKELKRWYFTRRHFHVIKMTYNIAMTRRVTMGDLVEEAGLDKDSYWGFRALTDVQFKNILELGGIDESLIVD